MELVCLKPNTHSLYLIYSFSWVEQHKQSQHEGQQKNMMRCWRHGSRHLLFQIVSMCRKGSNAGGTSEPEWAFRAFILLYFMVSRHTPNASHHIYIMTVVAGLTGSDLNCLFFRAAGDLIKGTLNGKILKTSSLLTGTIQKGLSSMTGNVNESPLQRSWSGKTTQ